MRCSSTRVRFCCSSACSSSRSLWPGSWSAALAAQLLALFTVPLWLGGGGEPRVFPFVLVVGGYAGYQLLRPAPRRSPTESDEESRS